MPRTILHFKETLDVVQSYHHYVSIRFLFKKGENEDLFLLKADISMLSIEFTFIHYFYSNITFGARSCKMREFYIDILYWTFFEVTNDSKVNQTADLPHFDKSIENDNKIQSTSYTYDNEMVCSKRITTKFHSFQPNFRVFSSFFYIVPSDLTLLYQLVPPNHR